LDIARSGFFNQGGTDYPKPKLMRIAYLQEEELNLHISYPDGSQELNLKKFREKYKLDTLIFSGKSDFQHILNLRSWIHSRAENSKDDFEGEECFTNAGTYVPSKNCKFLFTCLESLGFIVRTNWLIPKDINEETSASCYKLKEVYLPDLKKWFFIDPEVGIIITKDEIPLNAVELQEAMQEEEEIEVLNPSEKMNSEEYLEKIGPYLYIFSISLNLGSISCLDRLAGTKKKLSLIPMGADLPQYFQEHKRKRTHIFTNSVKDLYSTPKISD
jgi:hypothetical protein